MQTNVILAGKHDSHRQISQLNSVMVKKIVNALFIVEVFLALLAAATM